jgi:P2 family phage contractile tail tube protein
MDKNSAVLADTMYVDKSKAGEDVSFELPSIALQTADLQAMGTLSLPLVGLLDDMTLSITKIGVDKGFAKMSKLKKMEIEFRWVQDQVNASGDVSHKGCKAFLNVIPQELPSVSVEPGSATELSPTYTVTRYQLFYDGSELLLVDRFNQILRVNGVDYMDDVRKLL